MNERYELVDGKSSKFWAVRVDGTTLTTQWGRIGTDGQTKEVECDSADKAMAEARKAAEKKVKKGYQKTAQQTGAARPATKKTATKKAATKKAATKKAATKKAATKKAATKKAATKKAATKKVGPTVASADATADSGGVVLRWTDELKKAVLPYPGEARPPRVRAVDDAKLFKDARNLKRVAAKELNAAVRGELPPAKQLKAEAWLAGAVYEAEGSWPKKATLMRAIVDRWIDRHGLVGAVTIISHLRAHGGQWDGERDREIFSAGDHRFTDRLRHWACASSLEERAAAHAKAKEIVTKAGQKDRHDLAVAYAFLFPSEDSSLIEEAADRAGYGDLPRLYGSVFNRKQVAMLRKNHWSGQHGLWFAQVFGAEGYEVLKECLGPEPEKDALIATLPYVGAEPAADVAAFVGQKDVARRVTEYMVAVPELAVQVLRPLIQSGSKTVKKAAQAVLTQVERAQSTPASSGPGSSQKKVTSAPPATKGLPSVLTDPPWRKKTKSRPWPFEGSAPEVDLPPACRKGTGELSASSHMKNSGSATNVNLSKPPGIYQLNWSWVRNKERVLPPEDAVEVFGADAIEGLLAVVPDHMKSGNSDIYPGHIDHYFEQWLAVGTTGFVPHLVVLFGRKDHGAFARGWARKYPAHTMAGLVPLLFNKASKTRDQAHRLLAFLDEELGDDAVRHAREAGFGDAYEAWQALDPLERAPHKASTVPAFVRTSELRTKSGAVLSSDQVNVVLELCSFAREWNYAGTTQLLELLDPASADNLAKACVDSWVAAGSKTVNGWLVDTVSILGSPHIVPWLKQQLAQRLSDKDENGALHLVQQLVGVDSPSARLEVVRQYHDGRAAWLRRGVAERLDPELAKRGFSLTEYEDQAVPEIPPVLPFNGTDFRVRLDAQLTPRVADASGLLKRIPSGSDAEKRAWELVRDDGRVLAALLVRRFERLLIDGSEIDPARFTAWLAHPIFAGLMERIVFAVDTATFRVSEDRTFSDASDEEFSLPENKKVRVAHPSELEPGELARWQALFADYDILQPFPQLDRSIDSSLPLSNKSIELWKDRPAHGGLVMALGRKGWSFDIGPDGVDGLERELLVEGKAVRVSIGLHPTIYVPEANQARPQLSALSLDVTAKHISPRTRFELVYAIESVLVKE
ncbi:MAG: DUF4132 domain-containing protein [Myxococcota bacterium]